MKTNSRLFSTTQNNVRSQTNAEKVYLYGFHTVEAALKNPNRRNIKLYLSPNMRRRFEENNIEIKIPVEIMQPKFIAKLVSKDAVHQGIVLETHQLVTDNFKDFAKARLILALDHITDPHNVGAIMRSAVAMDVDAIVTTSRYSPVETSALAKSASGALDMIPYIQVQNLARFLEEMGNQGFQRIALDSDAKILFDSIEISSRVVLVLGSEGKGVRYGVRQVCDSEVRLEISGKIHSLNVSNAAAISLYLLQHKIGKL